GWRDGSDRLAVLPCWAAGGSRAYLDPRYPNMCIQSSNRPSATTLANMGARVEIPGRHRGALVLPTGRVQQGRSAWPQDRRATELERAAAAAKPDGQAVALKEPTPD